MTVKLPEEVVVDSVALREEVKSKYREVALDPHGEFHFHTGRYLARRLGYDDEFVQSLPDAAVESFAGVANPFALRKLSKGERVVDVGSGAGFDSFVAADQVGPAGRVVGVDMTEEMLTKSRATAAKLGLANVEFREGLAEDLPVEDGWADVVISNGVINLCADKKGGVHGNLPCFASGWKTSVRRYCEWQIRARGCDTEHRSLDGLNRRWSAVCSLAKNVGRDRICRRPDRIGS
jgi:arsenite methyltransferase